MTGDARLGRQDVDLKPYGRWSGGIWYAGPGYGTWAMGPGKQDWAKGRRLWDKALRARLSGIII